MEEGEEEPEGASPRASSYVAGDSTADLAGLGHAEDGMELQPAGRSMPNGSAQHAPGSPRASARADHFSHEHSSSAEHDRHGRSAKLPRHRVRAAVRRAPQYATEGAQGLQRGAVAAQATACLPCLLTLPNLALQSAPSGL